MRVGVLRYAPETGQRAQAYQVDAGATTTVLDLLVEIQRSHDPTLAFRYACRVGMCGSCAMVINGRERWACRTRVATLGTETIELRPLYQLPIVRDLVVDMAPFHARMQAAGAAFRPGEAPAADAPRPRPVVPREAIDRALECIGCGACVSACPIVGHDPRFLGPAALNRGFTVVGDARDAAPPDRWDALFSEDGVWRCHGVGHCTEVCPMELAPADSIRRLKRLALTALLPTLRPSRRPA